MGLNPFDCAQFVITFRIADFEFAQQVIGFKLNLPACDREVKTRSGFVFDFFSVKLISPKIGFITYGFKIESHGLSGVGVFAKPDQLRVASVAPGFACQYFLSQESLAPKGNQAPGIKIFWMKGP